MLGWFKRKRSAGKGGHGSGGARATGGQKSEADIRAVARPSDRRRVRRRFPGPAHQTGFRLALEPGAYSELVAHAKENLDFEVCGVLAGEVCEDDSGPFVLVTAALRGTASRHSATHVTFTHETWNEIHRRLDREFPSLAVVGWYHSHPGFGVEFSEMDLFIHRNFFPGPNMVALVTDPLGGDVAVCHHAESGVCSLPRFYVGGREHTCRASTQPEVNGQGGGGEAAAHLREELRSIEVRLGQALASIEQQRVLHDRTMTALLAMGLLGVVTWIAFMVYDRFVELPQPPRTAQYVPVPIQVGDKVVLLGVGVVNWEVPPKLMAAHVEAERQLLEAARQLDPALLKDVTTTRATPGSGRSTTGPEHPAGATGAEEHGR